MNSMKLAAYLVIFFGSILGTLVLAQRAVSDYPPPVYVPVAGYYDDGKLVDVRAFPEHRYSNLEVCKESLSKLEFHSQTSGSALRAVCFPFPETAQ